MSTNFKEIGDLLFGQTRGRVLALLFGQPDRTFYLRQIARETATSAGSIQRELEALAKVGLIQRTGSGHQVYFQANGAHKVFADLQSLVAKTVGLRRNHVEGHAALAAALSRFGSLISLAFLYKSTTSAFDLDENPDANIDLMIVGDVAMDQIGPLLEPVERQLGCAIRPSIVSARRFRESLREGSPFFQSLVEGEKIVLIGEDPRGAHAKQ